MKMLNWVSRFNIFSLLDNHHYSFSDPSFECLIGAGSVKRLKSETDQNFAALTKFLQAENDWVFGHLGYDLKNEIENFSSSNFDGIQFPDMFFFIPEVVILLKRNTVEIGVINADSEEIYQQILSAENTTSVKSNKAQIKNRFSKKEYINAVKDIQQNIHKGDCYELNFCQEFYAENCIIDPVKVYKRLSTISPNPFGALYKLEDKFLLCFSPERYLKKEGTKILSQPIKGTSKREITDLSKDEKNRKQLAASQKDISENVMVVDLVRNDLSKVCEEGTVKVEELLGIYTFPQVHQMISTVIGSVNKNINISDIFKATFPMGSMTGMPKKRVMELIENYEKTKRGLFSGTVGYITPDADFDFNVVIRSVLYNLTNKYLSIQAGSAITFRSDAESEYEECLLKIDAIKNALD